MAVFHVCVYEPLHYRQLKSDKINALKKSQGDYNTVVILSNLARLDLGWWIQNIESANNPIRRYSLNQMSQTGVGVLFIKQSQGGVDVPKMCSSYILMFLE